MPGDVRSSCDLWGPCRSLYISSPLPPYNNFTPFPHVLQALLRCIALLKRLAQEHRLGNQSELDRDNTKYLETKCEAMFLKLQ